MFFSPRKIQNRSFAKKTTILLLSVVFFFVSFQSEVFGQKKFSKSYPATKNVRLELINRSGTITVEGWNKDEVRISAVLENSSTTIAPQNLSGRILINLKKDNQGKDDVGYANFTIKVPYSSTVDIETMVGNLNVTNVNGGYVRAHITTEGDITLTNISAASVSAENVIGDIFFDGEVQGGGTYRFVSTRGNINVRIPFRSSFRLVATAPSTRNISLGAFSNNGFRWVSDSRRVTGQVGDGSASLIVTNLRGNIAFYNR
jgi:DUF4097 and DUF4098 domain-containing protein YvlB